MSTHTPGPWAIGTFKDIYATRTDSRLATVIGAREGNQDALANAALIAAAPAMYEALTQADNIIRNILTDSQLDQRTVCGLTVRDYFATVQTALRLAEGRD